MNPTWFRYLLLVKTGKTIELNRQKIDLYHYLYFGWDAGYCDG